ncbi:MAG TPA: HAD family phosphatase [Actinomycetales bacterium]|nr:HAD family phosphatase [Actinomycetales bacterium]
MLRVPAAVLWDMDGTLVDTEPAWIATEQELVIQHGRGHWGKEDGILLVGQALPRVAEILRTRGEVRMEVPEILEFLISRVEASLKTSVPWLPGAYELLSDVAAAGIPTALVTMSFRRLATQVVPHAPQGALQAVITGDEVSAGKPDPEPYLKAAAELGVDPRDCVAIEDSIPGVASAEASGARVLAIQHFVEIEATPTRSRTDSLTKISLEDIQAIARGTVIDHLR